MIIFQYFMNFLLFFFQFQKFFLSNLLKLYQNILSTITEWFFSCSLTCIQIIQYFIEITTKFIDISIRTVKKFHFNCQVHFIHQNCQKSKWFIYMSFSGIIRMIQSKKFIYNNYWANILIYYYQVFIALTRLQHITNKKDSICVFYVVKFYPKNILWLTNEKGEFNLE